MSKIESIPLGDPEQLSKEATAHDETNMMRAKLEINKHTGKVPTDELERLMKDSEYSTGGREPTAEDYDAALAAVEELRELAVQETPSEKIRDVFGRLSASSALAGWEFLWVMMGVGDVIKDDYGIENFKDSSRKTDKLAFSKIDKVKAWRARFEGAAYQLRELKKNAKKYKKI